MTIVLAATVIWVVSALSSPRQTVAPPAGLTSLQQSDLEHSKALDALASGDTTAAVSLLEKALSLDSNNTRARTELERIRRDAAPAAPGGDGPDPSAPGTVPAPGPAPDDPAFDKPVSDLSVLLPGLVEGYSLGAVVKGDANATVAGSPTDPDLGNSRCLWAVHDGKTAAGAAQFIASVSKPLYLRDGRNVTVDGAAGYFGTDGTRFASVVYTRGRYVFEVVLTSPSESPSELLVEAQDAAEAFPDQVR